MFKNSQHLSNFMHDFGFAMKTVRPDLIEYDTWDYGLPHDSTKKHIESLLDMNVYRRNGELRMPYSCKFSDPKRKMMPTLLTGIDQRQLLKLYDRNESTLLDPAISNLVTFGSGNHQITYDEAMFYAGLVTFIPKKVTVTHLLSHQRANISLKRANAIPAAELIPDMQEKNITFGHADKSKNFHLDMKTKRPTTENESGAVTETAENAYDLMIGEYEFFELLSNDIQSAVPSEYFSALTLLQVLPPGIVIFASKGIFSCF